MGETDRDSDDRTFRINFVGDGAARLRERVKDKLKEFMGDYTDDTLVEYVIVLLRNGRRKDEAKRELNVFLGDDSESFVIWLWDHLSLNLNLYIPTKESVPDEIAIRNEKTTDHFGRSSTLVLQASGASHTDSEHEGGKMVNISRSRRNREWKGLVSEISGSFPLRSTVIDALQSGEKSNRTSDVMNFSSSSPQFRIKRRREDETRSSKRDTDALPKLAPSRRLLEFAVRDAVKTAQQPTSKAEPALKRLRSTISTSTDTMLGERPQRSRSTLRMSGSMSVALKAAVEAAEDVTKSRNAGGVFDRLGHVRATAEPIDQSSNMKESILHGVYEEFDQFDSAGQVEYKQRDDYDGELIGNSSMFVRDADMVVDSASDNDGYDDFGISNDHGLDASQYSAIKKDDSVMLHYDVSKNSNAVVRKTRLVQQDAPPSASAKPSSKIVNISVNVNTWKPPDYQVSKNVNKDESRQVDGNEGASVKPIVNVEILKESTSSIAGNGKEILPTGVKKVPQKTISSAPGVSYTTSRPLEAVDSRTIFLSNVHFAATKDTLSRHFNKFGEVLKVLIVTDPTTAQPVGSAYVEFLRKESAELALSLNGTSFMSRILKVVRRSSVEAPVTGGWPRVARPSPFATRLGRMPFPRGILPTAFRARLPLKPGARSLQWKRDSPAGEGGQAVQISPRTAGRNLTYVRPESKA